MIDEPRKVSAHGGIDDKLVVHAEEIAAADPAGLVLFLSDLRHVLPDHLSHVLDHHLLGSDRLQGEQTPRVDPGAIELQLLLPELELIEFQEITSFDILQTGRGFSQAEI